MTQTSKQGEASTLDIDVVGGTTVLNFINTLRADRGTPLETLQTDSDVHAWLQKMKLTKPRAGTALPKGVLLESARRLRGLALRALEQKVTGKPVRLAELNAFLLRATSHLVLSRSKDTLNVRREYSAGSAEEALAPLADAIAVFLASADFSRIRQCQGAGCVLWFQDRPNGRPRRFCTEETCGTRTRVAAHRARQAKLRDTSP